MTLRITILLLIPVLCIAYVGDWSVISDIQEGLCATTYDGYVWFGTEGGAVKLEPNNGNYTVYTNADGLGGLEIVSLVEDAQGYLWYASKNGYIGVLLDDKWYSSDELAKNFYQINRLVSYDENIWVCTSNGIIRANPVPTTFSIIQFAEFIENFSDFPPQTEVDDIVFFQGKIFVATPLGIAFAPMDTNLTNPSVWETTAVYNTSDSTSYSRGIIDFAIHHDTLFALAPKESWGQPVVYYFDDGTLDVYEPASSFSIYEGWDITSLDDTLWVMNGGGLYYFSDTYNSFLMKYSDGVRNGAFGITEVDGRKFCATGYGYGVIENDTIEVTPFNSILGKTISDVVFTDSVIVVTTSSKAVNIFDGKNWRFLDYYGFLPYFEDSLTDLMHHIFGDLRTAIVTSDGTIWLGSYGSGILKIYPDSSFQIWTDTNSSLCTSVSGMSYPIANRMRLDPDGNLWVVSYNSSDNEPIKVWTSDKYDDPYGAVSFGLSRGVPNKSVRAIACNSYMVSVATAYGAGIIIHNGTIGDTSDDTYISLVGRLHNDEVNATAIDPDGKVWFGTMDGLAYWDPAGYVVEIPMPEDISATIISLAADSLGNVWIGTLDGAAEYMHDGYFATFKSSNSDDAPPQDKTPLLDDAIGTIAGSIIGGVYTDGKSGDIWFGFNDGLVVLHSPYKKNYEIEEMKIFPNPAIARRGITPTVYISNVPPDAPLLIYDSAGNLVREIAHYWKGQDGVFRWDCKNNDGELVAPGVYSIAAPSENGIAKGKVFFVR